MGNTYLHELVTDFQLHYSLFKDSDIVDQSLIMANRLLIIIDRLPIKVDRLLIMADWSTQLEVGYLDLILSP